jgi:hypothetical protein
MSDSRLVIGRVRRAQSRRQSIIPEQSFPEPKQRVASGDGTLPDGAGPYLAAVNMGRVQAASLAMVVIAALLAGCSDQTGNVYLHFTNATDVAVEVVLLNPDTGHEHVMEPAIKPAQPRSREAISTLATPAPTGASLSLATLTS